MQPHPFSNALSGFIFLELTLNRYFSVITKAESAMENLSAFVLRIRIIKIMTKYAALAGIFPLIAGCARV
jgi:hypothetical protein